MVLLLCLLLLIELLFFSKAAASAPLTSYLHHVHKLRNKPQLLLLSPRKFSRSGYITGLSAMEGNNPGYGRGTSIAIFPHEAFQLFPVTGHGNLSPWP